MRKGIIYICLLFYYLCNVNLYSQVLDREVAIAAYIYNFSKNIQWSNESSIKEFNFLIISSDDKLKQNLNNLAKTKKLRNKPVRINFSQNIQSIENIHLLFLSKEQEKNFNKIFDKIEGKNILLVTDNFKDKSQIMINFFNVDDGSLKFEINKANIINQHLEIMPDMILLGGSQIDVAALYYEGQQNLKNLKNEIKNIETKLTSLQSVLDVKSKEIINKKDSLIIQSQKIQEQQNILTSQEKSLSLQRIEELNLLKKLENQQILFADYSQKLILQKNKLDSGNKFLFKQKKQMDLQHTQILKQNSVLKQQGSKIQKQRNLVYLLVIIIFLTVLLAISIWNFYRNIRKFNKELNQRVLDRTKELHVLNEQLNIELNERKLAEIEIQKLNQTLEQRVAERTNQLKVINKELESFSYSISHDLRAPLRAIFGFSQILSRRHKDSLNEEGQQYMNYIVEASVRMEQLINDLLNYSRLGRKSLDLHPVSLKHILNNIYIDFKQKFDEIGANFKVSDNLPDINGDETLLMQIFINLIENAITYRRTAVPLTINIDCEQNQANVIIKVSDNGIGIPKEYWEKIFNIFQRLHSEDQYPGTGIGLATVKKAVSMLNGTISVESIVDAGSVFIINFPLNSKSLQNE